MAKSPIADLNWSQSAVSRRHSDLVSAMEGQLELNFSDRRDSVETPR